MRHLALVAALSVALPALPQEGTPSAAPGTPTGLTATVSLGGGGELGLDEEKVGDDAEAGVFEVEAAVGWELSSNGVRPELAVALGVAPDTHFALRPGVRVTLPGYPIQLRVALDAANARDGGLDWRWLLVGAAAELRLTGLFALYGEVDTGAKLSSDAGLPLLVRAGVSFRL